MAGRPGQLDSPVLMMSDVVAKQALKLQVIDAENQALRNDYFLLYRPPDQAFFCLEPVTHPIDCFHLPDRPGLRVLRTGESLAMQVQWRFTLSC
jgi:galactose mutarotase-like enzyme